MRILESARFWKRSEPELWTLEQGLAELELLNGQTVNLSSVLKKHRPDHMHYRPNWYPGQPEEPKSLKEVISATPDRFIVHNEYNNYFKKQGLEDASAILLAGEHLELVVDRFGSRVRGKLWPAGKIISLFGYVDFFATFRMTTKAAEQSIALGGINYTIGPTINTTKIASSIYTVEVPMVGSFGKIPDIIDSYAKRHDLPENTWGIGDYVIERDSQWLVTDLLAARV